MRFILVVLLFVSCQPADPHSKAEAAMEVALKNKDTTLAKELAGQELERLKSTITDSGFATMLDAGLQIQNLTFPFSQKADTSVRITDEIITNHADGQRLYTLMMKSYKLALQHASRSSDIAFFNHEISMSEKEWLDKNFAGKTNPEAKKSLLRLQRDIAIISIIVNGADSDEYRKLTEDSYKDLN